MIRNALHTFVWIAIVVVIGFTVSVIVVEVPRAAAHGIVRFSEGRQLLWERASAVGDRIAIEMSERWRQKTLFVVASHETPLVSAEAYIVGDLDSGEILLAHAEKEQLPIASVSKLFTQVVSQALLPRDIPIPASKKALSAYGTTGNLVVGEELTPRELAYPLLLESSNDAAEMLAESAGRDDFIAQLNTFARTHLLHDTVFEDPSGLSVGNRSTAFDLFLFGRYLYASEQDILKITNTNDSVVPSTLRNRYHRWMHSGYFIKNADPFYVGGKTGFIPEAAQTGVAFFSVPFGNLDTRTIMVAVLGSSTRNRDIAALVDSVTMGEYARRSSVARTLLDGTSGRGGDDDSSPLSLVFVGDIMMDRGVRARIDSAGGDYRTIFSSSEYLGRADIAFANLEGPLSNRGYDLGGAYSFRMDPKAMDALSGAGFDVVSVANNHSGDWGRGAFEDTLVRLKAAGIESAGGGTSRLEAKRPRIIERGGTRVAFLAFSDLGPAWLSEDIDSSYMLTASDPDYSSIITAAANESDTLVVSIHFGDEYEQEPTRRQRELAHAAIDAGARIVIGHHPHVIQPIEEYNGGVIAYSLGNFIFDQDFSEETKTGMALEVLLKKDTIVRVNPRLTRTNENYQPQLLE
ncbi:MAG: CapA family protein [Candidatus Vogelbacteria bacterium]|nr:CapA family protein [Candidatus Vogelbacteria bacterium]